MTIKFGKFGHFAHFIVRNFVVIWEAPINCDAMHFGIRQKGRVRKGLEETWTWDILTSFQLHTRDME